MNLKESLQNIFYTLAYRTNIIVIFKSDISSEDFGFYKKVLNDQPLVIALFYNQ